jgi:uncharacterized membrane protein YfcA
LALAAIPFGLAIGLSVGALGGGGSVLAVPVLVYVLGQAVPEATTTSLVVVTVAALAGGVAHARLGRVCWRHAAAFTAWAAPGVLGGTLAGELVSGSVLLAAFAPVMLVAAATIWIKASGGDVGGRAEGDDGCPPLRPPRTAAAGLGVGLLTGFFGVGGGFLIVPALALALSFSMRAAVGTSLAIITVTSLLGVVTHLLAGRTLEPEVTIAMSCACAAGAVAGAAVANRVPQPALGRAFAMLVAAVAGYLLLSAAFLGGPPGS